MKLFKILFITILPYYIYAQALSIDNISRNIQSNIQTHISSNNKVIIEEIYSTLNYQPLWIGESNKKRMTTLIKALKNPLFNYKNRAFDQRSIRKLFYLLDNDYVSYGNKAKVFARLDLLLTNSLVRLVGFIVQGDVDWNLVQKKLMDLKDDENIRSSWEISPKQFPDKQELISSIENGNIYNYLNSLIPMKTRYKKLIKLLKKYKKMDKFPHITYHKNLKLGDRSKTIINIKRRLQISGDYPKYSKIDIKFDKRLQRAILKFQKRYLLEQTGRVDGTMIYYLNRSIFNNIKAIITNLDKTKIYPKEFESEHIVVNIPDFNLRYYKNGRKIMKKPVVVGRIDRPTPLFSHAIRYMVINPTWTIPDSLIKRDLIPVLRDNPSYLIDHNILVYKRNREINVTQEMLDPYEKSYKRVPYRFVQQPSKKNALGRVKFMFPNKYAVYLHDTDNHSLFKERYRIYSSGCMRLKKPFALVKKLLQHSTKYYSSYDIDEILQSNKPTTIRLKKSIPVHIIYFTVYEENGLAYFKNDIYLYDKIIQESVYGNMLDSFSMPTKRMIKVTKVRAGVSN